MKRISITIGITLILIMLLGTYLISGIYAINEDKNTTIDIETSSQPDSAAIGVVGAAIGVVGNATSEYKFEDIIAEGKSTFLNVQDIKPNTVIKYNKIACIDGLFSAQNAREVRCEDIGVIGGEDVLGTPKVASSLLSAVSEGIEKPIIACFYHAPKSEMSVGASIITAVKCGMLFIVYN
jgi:hypothetical protein